MVIIGGFDEEVEEVVVVLDALLLDIGIKLITLTRLLYPLGPLLLLEKSVLDMGVVTYKTF